MTYRIKYVDEAIRSRVILKKKNKINDILHYIT